MTMRIDMLALGIICGTAAGLRSASDAPVEHVVLRPHHGVHDGVTYHQYYVWREGGIVQAGAVKVRGSYWWF